MATIASGYYVHSAFTAFWAAILGVICLWRVRRALAVSLTRMFFRVTPGVLFYCILVIIEAVDFEGLYGIYDPSTPAAIRIVETDDLACCSFGAMHLILTMAYAMDRKTIPTYVAWLFVGAAAFKIAIGVATAIAFIILKEKRVMIYNDTALLVTFVVSIGVMIRLVWQVQAFLTSHLERVPSEVLSQSLVKMRRILVITVLAGLIVPGFLIYNIIDHYDSGTEVFVPPDPTVYKVGYSIWFKLVWASFLLWLSRPTNDTMQTEVDSKGVSRTQTLRTVQLVEGTSGTELSRDDSSRPELDKQTSAGSEESPRKMSEPEDSGSGMLSSSPDDRRENVTQDT